MKTQHTPGPWTYTGHYFTTAKGHICMNGADEDAPYTIELTGAADETQEQLDANGRLIAAAPTMAEKLEAIEARINGEWDNPALLKLLGPLNTSPIEDIQKILNS